MRSTCGMVAVLLAVAAADAEEIRLLKTWRGRISAEQLRAGPRDGFIADRATLAATWKAWNVKGEPPGVDFTREILLTATGNASVIGFGADLKEGDVVVLILGTGDVTADMAYQIALISRKGVKSVNGTPLPPAAVAGKDDAKADAISGKSFKSVNKLERGLSPKGIVLGHWSLSFKGGKFTWDHSDVSESGSYVFDPATGKITGMPRAGKLKYEGVYDAKTGTLTWEKEKYVEAR